MEYGREVDRRVEGEITKDRRGDDSIIFRMWLGVKTGTEADMTMGKHRSRQSLRVKWKGRERGKRHMLGKREEEDMDVQVYISHSRQQVLAQA